MSDAAADLTASQTWAVIDDEPPAGHSAALRTSRDWGSHAEDVASDRPRGTDGGGAPGGQTIGPRRAHGTGRPAPRSGDRAAAAALAARTGWHRTGWHRPARHRRTGTDAGTPGLAGTPGPAGTRA